MKSAPLLFACLFAVMLGVGHAAQKDGDQKERIKQISERYSQIEAQLDRSVHYLRKEENADGAVTEQVWLTEARDLLKVSTVRKKNGALELTEIFYADAYPVFVLERRETPNADNGTHVEEARRFINANLIRMLTKKADFSAGDPRDTVRVKNVQVDLAKLSEKDRDCSQYDEKARQIAQSVIQAGPPERDPSAGSPGDSARFRLIQLTSSPDGRFALGFGVSENPVPWEKLAVPITDHGRDAVTSYQHYYYSSSDDIGKNVRNYVVDLATHQIIGETGCRWNGTDQVSDHRLSVRWSLQNRFFVQICEDRSGTLPETDEGAAGWIDQQPGKAVTTDLLKPAQDHAYQFLISQKDRKYRQFVREDLDVGVTVECSEISDDGTISLDVSGESRGHKGGSSHIAERVFHVIERFQIKRAGDKASLQFLDARMSSP